MFNESLKNAILRSNVVSSDIRELMESKITITGIIDKATLISVFQPIADSYQLNFDELMSGSFSDAKQKSIKAITKLIEGGNNYA